MTSLIEPNLEFVEIINAFPILKESLNKLNFSNLRAKEGISVHDYLKEEKNLDEHEIHTIIRKLNNDVNHFLKKGKLPTSNIKKANLNELGIEMI